ncbi:Isoflavone reductase [Glycine soja]
MLGLPFKMIVVLLDLPKLELPFKMTPYFPKLDLKSIIPFAENLKSELLGGIIALFIVGLTYIYYRMKKPKAKSKILVLGGTGYIGKFIVKASAEAGHPTFALVRESTLSHPEKSKLIESFKTSGVTLLYGDLTDHESLVKAIKQVDVVISTLGGQQIDDQVKLIAAVKEAGNIKRFLPSEFGLDVERHNAVEPVTSFLEKKVKIRRAIEAEGIPYTYICSNAFAGYFLPTLGQQNVTAPPRDKVVILGDGNVKAVYVKEEDIGTYTIKAVDDPRTLNKTLYVRPPANVLTFNELVSLWENKIKSTLEKVYIPEDQLLKYIQESPFPANLMLALGHSMHVKGDCTNYEIDPSFGVEASNLYPEVKYTTVDNYLNAPQASFQGHKLRAYFNLNFKVLLFCAMAAKSKILVIGGTGYIGKFIVKASSEAGHPTFALVRESTLSHPEKFKLIESFKTSGVTLLYGDLTDHESLVKAIKQVDVVISALGAEQIDDQVKIIAAIKEAGNIKRLLPSEFGHDVDHHNAVEPVSSFFEKKVKIRRAIEAEGIPYTYISSNSFAGHFLPNLLQQNVTAPPRDEVVILGDGNIKGVYVIEEDVATYTIKAVDDPRTLNKTLYLRPHANVLTFNELVSLWENKIKSTLDKIYVPEDQLLKSIQESSFPANFMLALGHSMLVKGDCNYEIDPSFGVEASKLYPEGKSPLSHQSHRQCVVWLFCAMAAKSKILVLGGTGYIGKFIVKASAEAGHPTFALVRESTLSHPEKSKLIESFKTSGGDVNDHESLVKAIKQVDVVISTLGGQQIDDQVKVIAAIKEAGNIKALKTRRAIEAEGIPYTYVCSYAFAGYFLPTLGQENVTAPPRDKVVILGNGNVKVIYVTEEDVGTYTIKAVEDPRTLNKTLHQKPPANVLTFNELVSLWENKIKSTLHKIYVPEDQILKKILKSSFPASFLVALGHSMLVKTAINNEADPSVKCQYMEALGQFLILISSNSMAGKDRILILGPTGAIGRHIVWASVKAGNPTFVLVRNTPGSNNRVNLVKAANPETKEELIESFKNSGVNLIQGDMNDHESLVNAIKQVDVVICAFGRLLIEDQLKIIAAIKEAGNVKRFFPSEFGLDVDRHDSVDPVREVFEEKARIRRIIEAEGIPYTYLCCHAFTGYFLRNLAQIDITVPPRDKVFILGDGNVKGAFVTEADVGTLTIEAANDPNALNKTVHIRLPKNYLTINEIISLWENKIGKTLEKTYVSEEKVLKDIKEASFPNNYLLALYHSQQIKGDAVYEIDTAKDLEASEAYPNVEYTTVDEYLNQSLCHRGRHWDLYHQSSGRSKNLEQNSVPETPCQCFDIQRAHLLMGEQDSEGTIENLCS